MTGSSPVLVAALTASALLGAGCEEPANRSPIVTGLVGPTAVRAGATVHYVCRAYDPDGWPWFYEWRAEAGRLFWNWGDSVLWLAPESSSRTTISVAVTDEQGGLDAETLNVRVLADTALIVDWYGAVRRGDYVCWFDTVGPGYSFFGRLRADTSTMRLRIADSSNFHAWLAGEPAEFLLDGLAYLAAEFEAQLLHPGVHFIILDNRASSTDAAYEIRAFRRGP